jgi:hypothetical protein
VITPILSSFGRPGRAKVRTQTFRSGGASSAAAKKVAVPDSRAAFAVERMPVFVGCVTLAAGVALVAAPRLATGPLGLDGQETAMRAIGASDLVLVPGLLRGNPRWPWMVGRAALNLAVAAYLHGVAPQSSSPGLLKAGAGVFVGPTAVDGATGLALRRAGSS